MPHQKTLTPRKGASPLFSGRLRGIQGRQELAGAATQARQLNRVSPSIQAQVQPFAQQARQRGRVQGRAQTVLAFDLQRKQEADAFRREQLRSEGMRRDASLVLRQRDDQFSRAIATKRLGLEEQRAEARGTEFQTQEARRREEFEARFGEVDPATGERRGGIERERITQREAAAEGVTERAQAAAQAEVTEEEQKASKEAARDRLRVVDDEFERFVDQARDAGASEESLDSGIKMDSFKAHLKRIIRETPDISEDEAVSQALESSRLTGGAAPGGATARPTTPRGRARGLAPGAPAAPAADRESFAGQVTTEIGAGRLPQMSEKQQGQVAALLERGVTFEDIRSRLPEAAPEPEAEEPELTENQQEIKNLEERLKAARAVSDEEARVAGFRRKSAKRTRGPKKKGTRGRPGVPTLTQDEAEARRARAGR